MPAGKRSYGTAFADSPDTRPKKKPKKAVLATRAYVNAAIARNAELKVYDITANTTVDGTGSVVHLNPIAQGNGMTNRDGNIVHMKSISLRWEAQAADATNQIRAIVIHDTDSNGATPAMADILQVASGNPKSAINYTNLKRFKVLMDIWTSVGTSPTTASGKEYRKVSFPCSYDGSATPSHRGGIYLVMMSDSSVSEHPVFSWYCRLRYRD